MLEDVWSIIQAEIPFTKKYAQASKVCLLGVVNHTQRRTTSLSGLGIVAEVKMNQSQARVGCAICDAHQYALFVKGISAWIIVSRLTVLSFVKKCSIDYFNSIYRDASHYGQNFLKC